MNERIASWSRCGGTGADLLVGGAGSDVLVGGAGRDTLTGGRGADRFEFHAGDSRDGDVVTDFSATEGDHIVFDRSAVPSFSSLLFTRVADGLRVDWGDHEWLLLKATTSIADAAVILI